GWHLQSREIAYAIHDAVSEGLLAAEKVKDVVLDAVLGDQVDDTDRPGLVLAPGTGDPLLELRRVPWQIDIDHGGGDLKVEPDAAAVGREEQAAGGIVLEPVDLGAALHLRH